MTTPTTPAPPPPPAAVSEYRARLWMGSVMALAAVGVLVGDHFIRASVVGVPFSPFLFVSVTLLSLLSALELPHLLDALPRPPLWLSLLACALLPVAGWPAQLGWT